MSFTPQTTLSNCDREPIHTPGSIQPHGCLLACDASATMVLRHSSNAPHMLGLSGDLNGQKLSALLGDDAAHDIRNSLGRTKEASRPALTFAIRLVSGQAFDVAAHFYKGAAIIELEPAGESVAEPIELARTLIAQLRDSDKKARLFRDTARFVRAMLGYDRVMVYKLGLDGAGKVVAESKRSDLESFLGQYFPGSDIPAQARALYLRNPIRIISNSSPTSVPIEPALDESGEPLDLSNAHLRSVSPIHCEYLCNMGVGASMSISIIVDGVLWGLLACHHYAPRSLSMAQRVAAEMFGEFLSLHVETLRARQALRASVDVRRAIDALLLEANRTADIDGFFRAHLGDFGSLVACDGVGMSMGGRWSTQGTVPPSVELPALLRFAQGVAEGKTWASNRLSMAHPPAQGFAAEVSGVLIIPMSQHPRDYLMLFRKEVVETLDWAGDPNKTYESGPLGDRLPPRKSFAVWKETVHHQSLPWTEEDRQFGEAIRTAIVEVALRNTELLAGEREKAQMRHRVLNEELNHRVKNILTLIGVLVANPAAENQSLSTYVTTLRGRIHALSLAHDQVVRGDGGGGLRVLLEAEVSPYRTSTDAIDLTGPNIVLDARAYSVMALVFHELATNAAKYGALASSTGKLSVTWEIDHGGACEIRWNESGVPNVRPPSRTGFGTVLIDRSVPFDLGGTSVIEYLPGGLKGTFRIPGKHLTVAEPTTAPLHSVEPVRTLVFDQRLRDRCVMILEDQLVIAVGLEQILLEADVGEVLTASSVTEAMGILGGRAIDAAVLDVNLGDATSIAVADELISHRIPFLFATGYGDSVSIPEHLQHVRVIRKPYEPSMIIAGLQSLLD